MNESAYSQNYPVYDKISTSAGELEMHFKGHASLMFRLSDFTIYIDPVNSEGSYDKNVKADLIMVTHEHYDHLDASLIENLRRRASKHLVRHFH